MPLARVRELNNYANKFIEIELNDWYFLALKVIFNYIASADTRIWNYLEENDNYVAASFKMRP